MEEEMMKQYMKNKSLFLQKEELLSRIAELFSKKILRPSGARNHKGLTNDIVSSLVNDYTRVVIRRFDSMGKFF